MTTKRKVKTPVKDSQNLVVGGEKEKSEKRKLTEVQLSPSTLNAMTAQSFTRPLAGELDITEAFLVLEEKSEKINGGDLSDLESTLSAQVVSLNAIFTALAKRSESCEYMKQFETNLRLALKAQAQCVRTAEVLAAIKNPPIVYTKQANIAHGHQQINNGNQPTCAGIKNPPNELTGYKNELLQDTGTSTVTSRINPQMETVEAVDRTENSGRQSQVKPKRL